MACATDAAPTPFPDSKFHPSSEFLAPDSGFSDQNGNRSLSPSDSQGEVASSSVGGASSLTHLDSIDHLSSSERLVWIQRILDLFFSNKISEAEAAVEPFKDTCIHSSHTKTIFSSVASFLTLDPVSDLHKRRATPHPRQCTGWLCRLVTHVSLPCRASME